MARGRRRAGLYFYAIACALALALKASAQEVDPGPRASERAPEAADRRKDRSAARRPRARADRKDAAVGAKAKAQAPTKLRGRAKLDDVNTWLIFGFTEGADVGEKGDRGIFQDSVFRATPGGAAAWDGAAGLGYSLNDRAAIYLAAMPSFERHTDQAGAPAAPVPISSRGFGAIGGFKYQLLRRGESPVGLALQVSPYWQRIKSGPDSYDTIGGEVRVIADGELLPGQWFGAVNLAYLPHRYAYSDGHTVRKAVFEVSAAASRRLSREVFVGAEIRYVRKHQGYFADHLTGHALYVGPTLFTSIGEHGYFGIAWSVQVAGRQGDSISLGADQEGLERHQLRVKAGVSF